MTQVIIPVPPYDFELALCYLQRSNLEIVERVMKGSLVGVYHGPDGWAQVTLTNAGTVDAPKLILSADSPTGEHVHEDYWAAFWTRRLHLDWDMSPFFAVTDRDPVMAALVRRFRGLRPVTAASVYESLTWGMIGQQINLRFAYQLKGTLVELAGEHIVTPEGSLWGFPQPKAVAALQYEDLTQRQFSRRKAEYVIDFARLVDGGQLDLSLLSHMDMETAIDFLCRIRGIGRWTAEYGLLRGIGHPDAFPAGDVGLKNAVARFFQMDGQPTEDTLRRISEAWSGWRGWAAFYLWFAQSQVKNGRFIADTADKNESRDRQ